LYRYVKREHRFILFTVDHEFTGLMYRVMIHDLRIQISLDIAKFTCIEPPIFGNRPGAYDYRVRT
jgi:hypothetical protein